MTMTNQAPKAYTLNTISDILDQVPADRLDDCLAMLTATIKEAAAMGAVCRMIPMGVDALPYLPSPLVWVDNGSSVIELPLRDSKGQFRGMAYAEANTRPAPLNQHPDFSAYTRSFDNLIAIYSGRAIKAEAQLAQIREAWAGMQLTCAFGEGFCNLAKAIEGRAA